jgi:hypothetical protein
MLIAEPKAFDLSTTSSAWSENPDRKRALRTSVVVLDADDVVFALPVCTSISLSRIFAPIFQPVHHADQDINRFVFVDGKTLRSGFGFRFAQFALRFR